MAASIELPSLDHLLALSDDTGVVQHGLENVPNRATGYCTADVARGFFVAVAYLRVDPLAAIARRLGNIYLAFLQHAQLGDGRFHNFMSYERTWLDEVGSTDSCGRAMWALGFGLRHAPIPQWRALCARSLDRAVETIDTLTHTRSQAYAAIGFSYAGENYAAPLQRLADELLARYRGERDIDWEWFEDMMTYDNARLPEALLRAAVALRNEEFGAAGLATLGFYERVTLDSGVFVPIGNDGWYRRGGPRARFAQQPLEALGLVDAELAAYEYARRAVHMERAEIGLSWFAGKNARGVTMAQGGGCYDGLGEADVNTNMGAESTLAYLAAAAALAQRRAAKLRVARTGN